MKILQIMVADGWYAQYKIGNKEQFVPLAAWALIEHIDDDGNITQFVTGMEAMDSFSILIITDEEIKDSDEFLGYIKQD